MPMYVCTGCNTFRPGLLEVRSENADVFHPERSVLNRTSHKLYFRELFKSTLTALNVNGIRPDYHQSSKTHRGVFQMLTELPLIYQIVLSSISSNAWLFFWQVVNNLAWQTLRSSRFNKSELLVHEGIAVSPP